MAKKKKTRSVQTAVTATSPAEAYEAAYFARKCGLTQEEALRLMREAQDAAGGKAASGEKPQG
ncbi:hypothetical protein [Mesorhizobium sp. ORS 3428]|uniref:hypothetical protein n=1 Tax=Mesorhizobium sp. ORS 3428 TaxID=540997 RepID=UPI0008D910AD|nr:hypothetical protein [Mesorhizobium sp. ORS 3428]OHV89552.1 hypothetical protein ORS3428_15050 [Mesorhizobium sp. ORS 3428]